jgi:hypothetical protein
MDVGRKYRTIIIEKGVVAFASHGRLSLSIHLLHLK